MFLLVGLGNPGNSYVRNRHNIGFIVADCVHKELGFSRWNEKAKGVLSHGSVAQEKVLLVKPQTFMNDSGVCVQKIIHFYKIPVEKVLVVHDDLDLPIGRVRLKQGGGPGGHNGLRSLDQHIGPQYWRLRIGIGHPGHKALVHGHVLGNFIQEEQEMMSPLIKSIVNHLPTFYKQGPVMFMNKVSLRPKKDK